MTNYFAQANYLPNGFLTLKQHVRGLMDSFQFGLRHVLLIPLLAVMLFSSCRSETGSLITRGVDSSLSVVVDQQAHTIRNLKWTLGLLTVAFVFIYIMGRRRLMRKIWKRNRELREALEKADEASKLKSSFMRNISHEIRTPLHAINGFSELLCSPEMSFSAEEKAQMRQTISQNVETISIIIGELLELAKEETESGQDPKMDIHLNELCREVLQRSQRNNMAHLELRLQSALPDTFVLRTHMAALEQLLMKMVENAFKFTTQGSVLIDCSLLDKRHVQIAIIDTGVGVPKERVEHLFDSYVSIDDYKSGAGLDLAACHRQAMNLGGTLTYDDSYTGGSRFVITLPF